jgi:hypothetical protein
MAKYDNCIKKAEYLNFKLNTLNFKLISDFCLAKTNDKHGYKEN